MAEVLTLQIVREYRDRVSGLPENGLQDIGERRKLRMELQKRCNLTELVALNIINGHNTSDYVAIEEYKEQKRLQEQEEKA